MSKLAVIAKSLLPSPARRLAGRVVRMARAVGTRLQDACARSNFLSSIYYICVSRDFVREQRSVLEGIRQYRRRGVNTALLRRNIHRLEKGMVMRPRKERFALDYIEATVGEFAKITEGSGLYTGEEVRWFHDVLANYFKLTTSCEQIDRARAVFECAAEGHGRGEGGEMVPFSRGGVDAVRVDFEALHDLSRRRCSVRWFQQRDVPADLIRQALAVGLQSPSACNRQPFRFHFVTERESVFSVASLAWGTAGFCDNIPAVGVVIGSWNNFFSERDRHLPYIDSALAIGPFLLALETLGLGSCCLNWPDLKGVDEEMGTRIKMERHERVVMLIAIGYPDPEGGVPFSKKKNVEDICTFNQVIETP